MQDNNKTELKLHYILGFAILAAMFLGNMCRRAEAAPASPGASRVDIVGDIDMATAMLTPLDIARAGEQLVIVIDSNGGLLNGARAIKHALDNRRALGLKTKCYALRAFSAAFLILSYCDERYVTPYGRFGHHYPYLMAPRITVHEVDEMQKRLHEIKKEMDNWADLVFTIKAPLIKQYMVEEKEMSGRELCNTFVGFCHVSYIFPILEKN